MNMSPGFSRLTPPAAGAAAAGLDWITLDLSGGTDKIASSYNDSSSSYGAETFNFETAGTIGRPQGTTGGRYVLIGSAFDYSPYVGMFLRLIWADFKGYWNGSSYTAGSAPNTEAGLSLGLTGGVNQTAGWFGGFTATNGNLFARAGRFPSAGNYQSGGVVGAVLSPLYAWFPFGSNGPRYVTSLVNQGHATLLRSKSPDNEVSNTALTDLYACVLADVVYNHSQGRQRWEGCCLEYALVPLPT